MSTEMSPFLQACKGKEADHVPIWIMRQAGRYLPAYQAVRARYDFLTMCHTPELAAEVTLQPIREFGFDAAIIFSDILIPLEPMGIDVSFIDGKGPQLSPQIRTKAQVDSLVDPDFESTTGFVADALRLVRSELPTDKALIGFAGAPWTLACYAVEGMGSKSYSVIKALLNTEPETLHLLLEKLAISVSRYLKLQLQAGADAIQIFDSWADALSPQDYMEFSYPYIKIILDELAGYEQPKILFSKDAGAFSTYNTELDIDVLGVDWRVHLAALRKQFEDRGPKAYQGNLDPITLLGDPKIMLEKAQNILNANAYKPGYIFNLGHGITPPTPVENVRRLVDFVQSFRIGS